MGYTFGFVELNSFDTLNPFSPNSAFQMHGGGYFCSFLTTFFNLTLPQFFNIHPADFISFQMGIIKGIIIAYICYVTSSLIKKENKNLMLFAYLFFGIYFIQSIYTGEAYILSSNHCFFRYALLVLCYIYFISVQNYCF